LVGGTEALAGIAVKELVELEALFAS